MDALDRAARAVLDRIHALDDGIEGTRPLLIALDGRAAAGKTTLATRLAPVLHAYVLHMDDYFLRPAQRTPARLSVPGGNVDRERFLSEALLPLSRGEAFDCRAFDCQTGAYKPSVHVPPQRVCIVEGSYSCHPALAPYYDLRVFLTVAPDEQLRRIRARNGEERAAVFAARWIPLEEAYFAACRTAETCDLVLPL